MEKLFYSQNEKIAFYIAGYVDTTKVNAMIKVLEEGRDTFIKACEDVLILPENVQSYEILKSSRYKSMRVFYVKNIEKTPKNAFQLGKDWTMHTWISN